MIGMCNNIERLSLEYLRGDLEDKKKRDLEEHMEKCLSCQKKFLLISSNFKSPSLEFERKLPNDFNEDVMKFIDKGKYAVYGKGLKRKNTIMILTTILSLSLITGFAKPIKEELTKVMYKIYGNRKVQLFDGNNPVEVSEAKTLYKKYKDNINKNFENMNPGDILPLEMKTENGRKVKYELLKGETKNFVSFVVGQKRYYIGGHYLDSTEMKASSLQELKEKKRFFVTLDGMDDKAIVTYMDNNLIMNYKFDEDIISLLISSNSYFKKDGNRKSINILGFEGVYEETEEIIGKQAKISLYLGDEKNYNVLDIVSKLTPTMTKDKLISICEKIKFNNEEVNNIKPKNNEFFCGVQDKRIEKFYDEFLKKVNKKNKPFTIKINDEISISAYDHTKNTNIYDLIYEGSNLEKFKEYTPYPLMINKNLFKKISNFKLNIHSIGYKGPDSMYYWGDLGKEKSRESIDVQIWKEKEVLNKYAVLDLIMSFMSGLEGENKLIYDINRKPYVIYKVQDSVAFRTINIINEKYVTYQMIVPKDMLKNMSYEEFVNGLEFIK